MNERAPKQKIISPFSGDYARNKEQQRAPKGIHSASDIFGVEEIFMAFRASGALSAEKGVDAPMSFKDLFDNLQALETPQVQKSLNTIRLELLNKVHNKLFAPAVKEFFREFQWNKFPGEVISSHVNSRGVFDPDSFLSQVSNNILFSMVTNHAVLHTRKSEQFLSDEKEFRRRFIKNFNRYVQDSGINFNFSTAINKINNYRIHLRDFLNIEVVKKERGVGFVMGYTDTFKDAIKISSSVSPSEAEKIYTHEMFHCLSGGDSVLLDNPESTTSIDPKSGLVRKIGLVINKRLGFGEIPDDLDTLEPKLGWLNEATTEELTLLVFKANNEFDSYTEEMELLKLLVNNGANLIDKKLLYNAYFSDGVPTPEGVVNTPMRKFLDAIDVSYGIKDFLMKLDVYVAKNGLLKAIKALKTDPKSII